MTVFVNLFQNCKSGYMKLLPEFQIYLQSKKNREDKISLYLRGAQTLVHGNKLY